jgi:nitrogen fixation/metabolism regulation signal transduction histidine kinase
MVSLERDAVIIGMPTIRPVLSSGVIKYLLIVCAVLGAITLYLLATASANTALFAQHYLLLIALNGGLAVCLTALLGYQLFMLRRKLKAGVFGAKFTLRLVWLFALVAVLPGALVYGVSVQFVAKSIESWDDVSVEEGIEGGLNLWRTTRDNLLKDLIKKADVMVSSLTMRPAEEHVAALNTLREQAGVQEATLFTPRGRVIVFSGSERTGLIPELPGAAIMQQLRSQKSYSAIEEIPGKGLFLRVLVPVNPIRLSDDMRVLQLLQPVPNQLAVDAETVQNGQRKYQELLLARLGLRQLYRFTLSLTLLLALLTALSLAFLLSDRLTAPLSFLVEGTRAVAQGDFSQREMKASRDELGVLTQSFNTMRQQLAETRSVAEINQAQLATAHSYLQSILTNLSAGVLAFDESFRLRSFNHSASTILDADIAQLEGLELARWHERNPVLRDIADGAVALFQNDRTTDLKTQIERTGKKGHQMLLLRGTRLPTGEGTGYVVVFDDITHVLQAQRDAAWTEVARRLAHEIKNPLTPIQLSAERLQHKLEKKLDAPDAAMLARSTQTIVNQVGALKNMVDAFREYARMPEPMLQEIDINELLLEVLTLYESSRWTHVEMASGLPRITGDPAQLRQIIHNLMQNAQDALADTVSPSIVVRSDFAPGGVCLTITDNGSGFPEQLMHRAFEPYMTTKPKGTGLGLVIVKKIVEEHGGNIEIANVEPHGARVSIVLPGAAAHSFAAKIAVHA